MIHLICDSMSDILPQEAEGLSIKVLPLHVHFGQESFEDGVTLTPEAFYRRMETATALPKTSQVAPEAFLTAFESALASPADEVLCITGGSQLSGTCQSALIAREMSGQAQRIQVVDSQSASLGTALIVREGLKLIPRGLRAAEIKKILDALAARLYLCGQVEDLKYLVMGGRLSSVGAKVGTVLKMKPMLKLEAGKLGTAGLCRGSQRAREWFVQQLDKQLPDPRYPILFASANAPESLKALMDYVKSQGRLPKDYGAMAIGTVIGSHTGPGCIAMCWIKE